MNSGVTPIMYSAFWNDTNTTQELINLGLIFVKEIDINYELCRMR